MDSRGTEGHAHHMRGGYGARRKYTRDDVFDVYWRHMNAGEQFAPPTLRENKRKKLEHLLRRCFRITRQREALYWG